MSYLTREQIEEWRAWHHNGCSSARSRESFNALCNQALMVYRLSAGRDAALEEVALLAEPTHKPKGNLSNGEHGRIAEAVQAAVYNERKQLASRIRALKSRAAAASPEEPRRTEEKHDGN